ncbi:hypothetical protein BD779DRAFT_1806857 [Infundibulicybe gibba]|nr:hypothetical protein BD779DRAFT_1806857 [Infundibulicybe gibba]
MASQNTPGLLFRPAHHQVLDLEMSGELLYIVDDTSNAIALSGGEWTTSKTNKWYNGTLMWPKFATTGDNATDTSVFGSLNYTFHGTSIAFVGNIGLSNNSQITVVTIDGNSPYNTSYDKPISQNYQQWYQSPHLDDGVHTIQLDNIVTTSVDIVVISAGPNTLLSGQTVIVDDDDPSIIYSGNWNRNEDRFVTSEAAGGLPFRNGTQQSTTPGDAASIRFTGTSVVVYGIFPWATPGSMSVRYTLDGSSSVKTYKVTPSSPNLVKKEPQQPNFLFFSEDSLAPGNHTLSINITEINNLTFVMDYLTYSPSFNSLTTKPNITAPTMPTPSTSQSTPLPTSSSSSTPSKNGLVRGVVGGIAGVVIVLALALLIIYKRRRRDRALRHNAGLESGRQRLIVKPYLLTVPPTRADATPGPVATINDVLLPLPLVPKSRDKLKRSPDSSLATSNPQRPITNLREDTLQRIRAVEALIAVLGITPNNDRVSYDDQIQINQLRQRINELAQGNSHPNTVDSPPAYEAGAP